MLSYIYWKRTWENWSYENVSINVAGVSNLYVLRVFTAYLFTLEKIEPSERKARGAVASVQFSRDPVSVRSTIE